MGAPMTGRVDDSGVPRWCRRPDTSNRCDGEYVDCATSDRVKAIGEAEATGESVGMAKVVAGGDATRNGAGASVDKRDAGRKATERIGGRRSLPRSCRKSI